MARENVSLIEDLLTNLQVLFSLRERRLFIHTFWILIEAPMAVLAILAKD
jgi:hypothetical protein